MKSFKNKKSISRRFKDGDVVEIITTGEQAKVVRFECAEDVKTGEISTDMRYQVSINGLPPGQSFKMVHEDDLKPVE